MAELNFLPLHKYKAKYFKYKCCNLAQSQAGPSSKMEALMSSDSLYYYVHQWERLVATSNHIDVTCHHRCI